MGHRHHLSHLLVCCLLAPLILLAIPTASLAASMSMPTGGMCTTAFREIGRESAGDYIDASNAQRRLSAPFHHGVDISGGGTTGVYPIYAAAKGKVVMIIRDKADYGTQVVIDHGFNLGGNGRQTYTFYSHMGAKTGGQSYVNVHVDQEVALGALLGYQGNDGTTYGRTGTHLDWEVRVSSRAISPSPTMRYQMIAADPAFYLGYSPANGTTYKVLVPECTSDAVVQYLDKATILFSAVGGVSASSVSYQIDKQAVVTTPGTSVTVETGGSGPHTLNYWATAASGLSGAKESRTFRIIKSGRIQAQVYDAFGGPLFANVQVDVCDGGSGAVRASGTTDYLLGSCTISGLWPGTYAVHFGAPLLNWYDAKDSLREATAVVVHEGETVSIETQAGPTTLKASDPFPICTHEGIQAFPAISANMVVWQDGRDVNDWNIYAKNLESGAEQTVCLAPGQQSYPAISGNIVVWEDNRSGDFDIYGYDFSTNTEFPVCISAGDQRFPSISGSTVVWEDNRNNNWDVFSFDLRTKAETAVETGPANQNLPAVSAGLVVWTERPDSNADHNDILGYNLAQRTPMTVCTTDLSQWGPSISGSLACWADRRSGDEDLWARRLPGGPEFPVCTEAGSQMYPSVSSSAIVWEDQRSGSWHVYGYDLQTREEFPICVLDGGQYDPSIDGNTVVWTQYGEGDLYGAELTR